MLTQLYQVGYWRKTLKTGVENSLDPGDIVLKFSVLFVLVWFGFGGRGQWEKGFKNTCKMKAIAQTSPPKKCIYT